MVKNIDAERLSLTTEIICSLLRARMTYMEGLNLLVVGKNDSQSGEESCFFYSNKKMYQTIIRKLYAKYVHNRGVSFAASAQKDVGIVAYRTVTGDAGLPGYAHGGMINLFSSITANYQVSDLLFRESSFGRNFEIGACEDYFEDIHIGREARFRDSDDMQTACLKGMETLFDIFTTEKIDEVKLFNPLQRGWWTPASMREAIADPALERLTLAVVRDVVYGIRDAFRAKDDGHMPSPTVYKDVVETIVTGVSVSNKPWLKESDPSPSLFRNTSLSARFREMASEYELKRGISGGSTVLPGLSYHLSNPVESYGRVTSAFIGLHRRDFLLAHDNGLSSYHSYEANSFNRPLDYRVEKYSQSLFVTILVLRQAFDSVDLPTLRTISKDMPAFEDAALSMYRFFNATQRMCAMDILRYSV